MSHRAHLPPSAHTSFITNGAVVCSFVPRPLEQDEQAVRVPFFHRNTDYDEFIFYHDGDFSAKTTYGRAPPPCIPRYHHGPHPKALANQSKKTHTDEYAVMLDGLIPSTCCRPAKRWSGKSTGRVGWREPPSRIAFLPVRFPLAWSSTLPNTITATSTN